MASMTSTSFVQKRAGGASQALQHHRQQPTHRQRVVTRAQELKRPELKRPDVPAQPEPAAPKKLFTEAPVQPTIATPSTRVVTIEYQRQRAKEMTKYFNSVKFQKQVSDSKVFGWTPANEISNGRWVMFGFAVGLLTEYATGVDFIEQFGQIVTYLGIADLE